MMEKKVTTLYAIWVVLFFLVLGPTPTRGIVSCGDAVSALIPCGSFLLGTSAPPPSGQCCKSAMSLQKMGSGSQADLKALCQCLKSTGPSFGVKPERAKLLPSLCKLQLSIPINPNVDCNKV